MTFGGALKSLWSRTSMPEARTPEGVRIYAIGDVHGCADLLAGALARIDAHRSAQEPASEVEIFLGDYVDRGPHSREVIDLLIDRGRSRTTICLAGNHEACMNEFLEDPEVLADWKQFGALPTLQSYGLPTSSDPGPEEQSELSRALNQILPGSHRNFLEGLRPSFECGGYFFVHAGVRPGVPLSEQKVADLLWIRQDFLAHDGDFGKVVVHGHTPVPSPEVRPNRINIDTGAFSTGQLTCLVLDGDKLAFI